jgi:protein phosphatase
LINTRVEPLVSGDLILLCSDGLSGVVGDGAIGQILAAGGRLGETAARLVEAAKAAGSEDNITVVLLQWSEG